MCFIHVFVFCLAAGIRGFDMILEYGSAQYDMQLYQIRNTKNLSKVLLPVGNFVRSTSEDSKSKQILYIKETVTWPGGGTEPPSDKPKCGWTGVCPTLTPTTHAPGITNMATF